jgi:hypothetical protein
VNDFSGTTNPHPPARVPPERSTWRASDADREQTASRLRRAASEGRLLADELEYRLESAFSARTYGELDRLICDLPTDPTPDRRQRLAKPLPVPLTAAIALVLAAVVTLVLIAAVAGIGFRRSGAAAPNQPLPRIGLNAVGP